jgi:hypothetical protein
MKKVLLTLAVMGVAASVLAQGTVVFNNLNTAAGIRAQIYGPEAGSPYTAKTGNTSAGLPAGSQTYTGPALNGAGFRAIILAANGANQAESSLVASTPITGFRTGSGAGYVTQVTSTLTGVPKDAPAATLQVVAWDNTSGLYNDYASALAAWNAGNIALGKSQLFNVNAIGGDLNPAPLLNGLQSFNIYLIPIPEPTSMALLGLGSAAMLIFRRRK